MVPVSRITGLSRIKVGSVSRRETLKPREIKE